MANKSSREGEAGKRIAFLSLAVIFIDQLSKVLFYNKNFPILQNLLHITYTENTGAGFGILQNQNTALIFISVFGLGIVIYYFDKMPWLFSSLLTGGLIGNLIDRIRLGYVVDFLDFRIWPVFNVADSCITIAAIGLVIYSWRK